MTERSFDDFCRAHRATYEERDALAWRLATIRARRLYEFLRPQPRWPRKDVPA